AGDNSPPGWPDAHTSGPHTGLVACGHLGRVLRVWAVVLCPGSAGPGRRSGEILAAGDELARHARIWGCWRAHRGASANASDRLAVPGGGTRLPDLHARRRDRDLLLVGGCAAGRTNCVAAALGIDAVECLRLSAATHHAPVPRRPCAVTSLARGRVAGHGRTCVVSAVGGRRLRPVANRPAPTQHHLRAGGGDGSTVRTGSNCFADRAASRPGARGGGASCSTEACTGR